MTEDDPQETTSHKATQELAEIFSVIDDLAGHTSISITQRYIDVNDDQLRTAVEVAID